MDQRENRLVRRLRLRDESAFREMVRTYQADVFNLVYRMIGNWEEAEDLAQEVFVIIFKAIENFRGDSKFSTWLYRIAVNTCKNRYKYLNRRMAHSTQSLDEVSERQMVERHGTNDLPLQGQINRPDKMMEGFQLEKAIQDAIASLEEDQRVLIVLRDVRGMSYIEIADITGLPEGTVKSRLHRARMALKDRLKNYM